VSSKRLTGTSKCPEGRGEKIFSKSDQKISPAYHGSSRIMETISEAGLGDRGLAKVKRRVNLIHLVEDCCCCAKWGGGMGLGRST